MSNLILGVTPTKKLTHRLYIGVETDWTLKENNQIAKATPPKTIFQNVTKRKLSQRALCCTSTKHS